MDPYVASKQQIYAAKPYGYRRAYMYEHVLPAARKEGWHEIFVVGAFEKGDGYTYIPMEPIYRDRRDALWQREFGARHATGDVLAFSHDDHMFAEGTIDALARHNFEPWDILVPRRENLNGDLLNNGRDGNYMGGHSLLMKRAIWAKTPWTCVDTEFWDVSLTRIWREEGAKIVWTDMLRHIDLDEPPLT